MSRPSSSGCCSRTSSKRVLLREPDRDRRRVPRRRRRDAGSSSGCGPTPTVHDAPSARRCRARSRSARAQALALDPGRVAVGRDHRGGHGCSASTGPRPREFTFFLAMPTIWPAACVRTDLERPARPRARAGLRDRASASCMAFVGRRRLRREAVSAVPRRRIGLRRVRLVPHRRWRWRSWPSAGRAVRRLACAVAAAHASSPGSS